MFLRRQLVALDLSPARIALAQFEIGRNGAFELHGLRSRVAEFSNEPSTRMHEQIAAFLRVARGELHLPDSITITLHPPLVLTKTISTPAVVEAKRAKIVQFETSQAIPFQLDEVCWDWCVMAEHQDALDVSVSAVKTDLVHALLAATAEARMTVQRIVPVGLALREIFRRACRDSQQPVLAVCIGLSMTHVMYLDALRYTTRCLSFGWSDRASTPNESTVARRQFIQRLTSELGRSLVHFQQQFSTDPISEIYVCGDGPFGDLATALKTEASVNVHLCDLLEHHLTVAPDCRKEVDALDSTSLGALVGSVASTLRVADSGPNLLPLAEQRRRKVRRRQPALVFAASCSALALVPPTIYFSQEHRALREELQRCDAERERLRTERKRASDYSVRVTAARHSAEVLQRLERSRTAWIALLADLENRVISAGDLWVDRLALVADRSTTDSTRLGKEAAPLDLEISGRVVERSGISTTTTLSDSSEQIRRLLTALRASSFVAAVHDERFEPAGPGALRFTMVLTLDQSHAF